MSNCVKRKKSHTFKRDKNARNKFVDGYKRCVGDFKKFFLCLQKGVYLNE